jgi:hypothetical protein
MVKAARAPQWRLGLYDYHLHREDASTYTWALRKRAQEICDSPCDSPARMDSPTF